MAMNLASSTSLSTNLAQKLRAEIKAKLLELTGEHEEELPDYIMVMVANQRTKYQMQDELELFLASQTQEFVNWLHSDALRRLGESSTKNDNKADSSKSKHRSSKSDKTSKKNGSKSNELVASTSTKPIPPPSNVQKLPTPSKPVQPSPTLDQLGSHADENNQSCPPSPPSPVIIINNQAIQNSMTGQQQQADDSDEDLDLLRQTVAASRKKPLQAVKIARVAPAPPLVSAVTRIFRVPQNHHEPDDYEEDMDDDEMDGRAINSVIKVKERQYLPEDRQASRRLFMQQTSFLRSTVSGADQLAADSAGNEDLRNVITRKRKRDWARGDEKMFFEGTENQNEEYMLIDSSNQRLQRKPLISTAMAAAPTSRPTRFIVTLGQAEKKMKFDSDLDEDVEIQIDEPQLGAEPVDTTANPVQRCRFYPNCRNADCPFSHEPDDLSTAKLPCKWFPKCQFGSSCKYRHPFCKFNLKCSKVACPYKHSAGHRGSFKPTGFNPSSTSDRSKFTWTKSTPGQ